MGNLRKLLSKRIEKLLETLRNHFRADKNIEALR